MAVSRHQKLSHRFVWDEPVELLTAWDLRRYELERDPARTYEEKRRLLHDQGVPAQHLCDAVAVETIRSERERREFGSPPVDPREDWRETLRYLRELLLADEVVTKLEDGVRAGGRNATARPHAGSTRRAA